ncbi:MAG TPA: IPT/TIG domain-containing protein, partial [Solirubrobacterales bacterium]|nr:IPT/TIG domain-containing protein [Solirubrobacterales bacterium]
MTALSPVSGSFKGGAAARIAGTDFADVYFGPTPAAGYTVNSQDEITAIAPPGKFGVTNVSVTTIAGTSPLNPANHFRFAACLAPVRHAADGRQETAESARLRGRQGDAA